MRVFVSEVLTRFGWNMLAYDEQASSTLPKPSFLAIAPHDIGLKLQIHTKGISRKGRYGAARIDSLERHVPLLAGWDVVIVSDRGYTQRAMERMHRWQGEPALPNLWLVSPEQWEAFVSERSLPAATPKKISTKLSADILVCGPVTPELLFQLASSRSALEDAIQSGGPRFIEELIAENWKREGYAVQLVKRSNAGGPDVVAVKHDSVVPIKVLASCKWKGPAYYVKKSEIAELLAWVEQIYPSNAGLLATNSRLQSGAVELIQRFHRISAINGNELVEWTMKTWNGLHPTRRCS